MQIIISGVDRTNLFREGTLEIEDAINERSTARLQLVDVSMTLELQDGQQIQIYDQFATLIFAGFILYPKKHVPITKNVWFYDIEAVDQHQIGDRWLVAKTYTNVSAQDIAADLWQSYLAQEGVTIGAIDGVSLFPAEDLFTQNNLFPFQSSVLLERASFPRVGTVSDAMNELSELTGYQWYIDYDKKFYFTPRNFFAAPFNITTTSSINNVQVKQDRSQYRNRQYIRGGLSQTDQISLERPTPLPDGVSRNFVTRFPLSAKPRIFVNSIEISQDDIGVNGLDTGKKYYYTYNQNTIIQDSSQTALIATDNIQVTYRGLVALALVAQDVDAIAARATLEGGTGVYERIEVDESISSRQEALDVANGKLDKYSKVLREITYDTYTSGLAAGQLQSVNLPEYNINSVDFLIDKVQVTELDGIDALVYTVHAVDGSTFGGWQKFYRDLLRQNVKTNIRENELLVVLQTVAENSGWTETTTATAFACSVPSDTLFPSATLLPC